MKLAEYLFARIHQVGVRDVFGVPGDSNLALLDYVAPAGLTWVGNCNELNAGYAADGYARLRGVSALITPFGVGELSAANAVAGAYAERVPVIHIIGTPGLQTQADGARVHHTFNDGDFDRFARIAKEVTVFQTNLKDPRTAADSIDHAIQQCFYHSRPVYIQLPADQIEVEVDESRLSKAIEPLVQGAKPAKSVSEIADEVLQRIYAAKKALVYVDGETRCLSITEEVRELVTKTRIPTFTSPFGKGTVNEELPNVYGIYMGDAGPEDFSDFWSECDLVVVFGPHYSLINTFMGRSQPEPERTITFTLHSISIPGRGAAPETKYEGVSVKEVVRAIVSQFDSGRISSPSLLDEVKPKSVRSLAAPSESTAPLTQESLQVLLQPLLRPGDVLLGETGTPAYLTRELSLPADCSYIGATTWLSIGYMLPATLGAALARRALAREHKPSAAAATHQLNERCVLLIGDGSFQMTAQEVSTMIRLGADALVLVVNNGGYTIERCLHGWRAAYNDVRPWRYAAAPFFFGAPAKDDAGDDSVRGWRASTVGELREILANPAVVDGPGLRLVELVLDKEDAPETLLGLTSRPPPKDQ